MDGIRRAHGGEVKCVRNWILSKWILEKLMSEVVDWIHLTQDGEPLQALVNTTVKLRVHDRRGIS
jgi:hypothetical protein